MALYYVMAVGASVCYSLQFVLMKVFQRRVRNNLFTSLMFGMIYAAVNAVLILAVKAISSGNLAIKAPPFTLIIAAAFALFTVLSTIVSILVIKQGKLSVYSNFMMLGGMAFPFVFGLIFMNEKMTVWKGVGMAVMVFSLIFAMRDKKSEGEEKKNTRIFYVLCFLQFAINGCLSIFSAVHANAQTVFGQNAAEIYDFIFWTMLFTVAISAVTMGVAAATAGRKDKTELLALKDILDGRAIAALAAYSVIILSGLLLALNCMGEGKLDASSLYPITTGGTIVLSAVFGLVIFKEKITKYMAVCLILTMAATVAFMF